MKRYKHVRYIKECRPSTIVKYEQHNLQRNTKMERKENGRDYKLEGMEDEFFSTQTTSFQFTI